MKICARSIFVTAATFFAFFSMSCGHYAPPVPPDLRAPRGVLSPETTVQQDGVHFAWKSPQLDVKGDELKSLDEYRIYRKEIQERADYLSKKVEFKLLSSIADSSVVIRDKLREEARAIGKVGRRIKAPVEATRFTFVDTTIQPLHTYAYKIVPVNQGGIESDRAQTILVFANVDKPLVVVIEADATEEITGDVL